MKIFAIIFLGLWIAGCSNSRWLSDPDNTLSVAVRPPSGADSDWRRIDVTTLEFRGAITDGAYSRLLAMHTPEIRTIVVNSGGGLVTEAIQIADFIRLNHLRLIVRGYCLSACANYIFASAPERVLQSGLVGIHGTISDCIVSYGGIVPFLKKDMTTDLPEVEFAKKIRDITDIVEMEKQFFSSVPVDHELMQRSCLKGKGLSNEVEYAYLIPNNHHLGRLGNGSITGEQDLLLVPQFNRTFTPPMVVETNN